jgi:photosystem II stability/assembly factor-like uncharacterized protein
MRTPSTAVRGVFVIFIILGVVFISNIGIVQSGATQKTGAANGEPGQLLLDELTPSPAPTPTATPNMPVYFPVITNNYGFLYSSVVIANGQGFDNCKPLSVEGMQNWWDNSPYSAVNIYLGGISALCPFDQLNFEWYSQVATQGWSFILTWAGPQSPVLDQYGKPKFRHPMSTDPEIAYVEGKIEALAAAEAAFNLGFKGQLVIYYDVESYSGADDDTRATVAAFIRGWTEQLHALGHIAGAYGAACTSYIVDWAFNDPPLDDVWIAQWNKEYAYDPDATVFNTTCLDGKDEPPIFWTNHQRLKQYTGPHNETWGGLTVKIDSDVLDGQVDALFGRPPEKNFQPSIALQDYPLVVLSAGQQLREIQLLSPLTGWVLREDQLLWSADSGLTWQDISPIRSGQNDILGVHFINPAQGWLVGRQAQEDQSFSLSIYQTRDGGSTWSEAPLSAFSSAETWELESAEFEFLDDETGWIAFNLHSGSNFSFGRLLATGDGGQTWEERDLPFGEPVEFQDAERGWTAGGPLDQVYLTENGGESWSLSKDQSVAELKFYQESNPQLLAGSLPPGVITYDLIDNQIGWAVVQAGTCMGYKPRAGEPAPPAYQPLQCESSSQLLMTANGGISWSEITPPE